MKLNIEFTEKSLEEAISELNKVKRKLKSGSLVKDFLEDVCLWIINRANRYLNASDIGELVKIEIRNGWEYDIFKDNAILKNTTDKAVFVEFGVGVEGEQKPHPNADKTNYEYDVPSEFKGEDGSWWFYANEESLDISPKSVLQKYEFTDHTRGTRGEAGLRLLVNTMGTEGVMYAYNAVVDAKNELKDPNSRMVEKWNVLLERYLG